jgi:carbonic anhydrase
MEFACKIAGSKIIAVLGHSGCGAVKGACDHVEMGNLTALLSKIRPAVDDEETVLENRCSENAEFLEKVTLINVKRTMQGIVQRSTILKEMIEKNEILLVGGVHELASGEVSFCQIHA